MNSIVESTIEEFINCYEQGNHHGIAQCTRTMSRIIRDKPELFLDANPYKAYPLLMMATECNMGEDAIAISYYLVLKAYVNSISSQDNKLIGTYLLMCITCILEHYHLLNGILVNMHPRIPFYHLDCQLQSLSRKYAQHISYTEQQMLKSKTEATCTFGWIDSEKADEVCNTSIKEYILDFERYLNERKFEKYDMLY